MKVLTHAATALAICALGTAAAHAAEIKVICTQALTQAMADIGPQFQRASGHRVTFVFGTTGALAAKVQGGEASDVVVLATGAMKDLAAAGKVTDLTEAARSPVGVAVKAGAPKPDISSGDAFRQALLAAPSVAYSDPADGGASGVAFAKLLDRMGIAGDIQPKAHLVKGGGRIGDVLVKGDAVIGVQMLSELLPVEGIDVVGPLPKDIELVTPFSAGVTVGAKEPDAGKAFIAFLASPAAAATLRKTGIEPGQ